MSAAVAAVVAVAVCLCFALLSRRIILRFLVRHYECSDVCSVYALCMSVCLLVYETEQFTFCVAVWLCIRENMNAYMHTNEQRM